MVVMSKAISQKLSYTYWVEKNWFYHQRMISFYQHAVPQGMRVLQIGSKTGIILDAVKPSYGVGVEWQSDDLSYARTQYQQYIWLSSLAELSSQKFDYIILSSAVMEVYDVQHLFETLQPYCDRHTRIIIDTYSPMWEPILWLAYTLKLRRPTQFINWISRHDISTFLALAGFDTVVQGHFLLLPYYIPLVSWLLNTYIAPLPLINRFCLVEWIVARPCNAIVPEALPSVSVVVPCKNERGNVERIVQECPVMGSSTEIIFVEGGSRDGTFEEIKRVAAQYPEKNIRYYKQVGKGKGDAVRLGFDKAQGDLLIILDADLTVPAQELPKFFDALVGCKGDFINGNRLVYGMENNAMRFLNLIANHCFGVGFSWLIGQSIKDTLCGTKVLYRKSYTAIANNRLYFGDFDPFGDFDLLFGAAKLHLKIIDMPIHYKQRTYGTTQIHRFYHGILLLKMFLFALKKFKFR